jgi:phosphatidylinositol-3-phosphatase
MGAPLLLRAAARSPITKIPKTGIALQNRQSVRCCRSWQRAGNYAEAAANEIHLTDRIGELINKLVDMDAELVARRAQPRTSKTPPPYPCPLFPGRSTTGAARGAGIADADFPMRPCAGHVRFVMHLPLHWFPRGMKRALILVTVSALALLAPMAASAAGTRPAPPPAAAGAKIATISKVMWIVMENRSFSEVVGAPYLSSLAAQGGLATNMHNLAHPSQPNYIAMTSGRPISQVPSSDCPTFCPVHGASIFGQNPSWRVYAESMPSNCLNYDTGLYRAHHTAAPYFVDLTNCQTNDMPLTQFNPASPPLFSLVIPNVAHDMHQASSSVAAGDSWLRAWLPQVLSSSDYTSGSLAVFITWD